MCSVYEQVVVVYNLTLISIVQVSFYRQQYAKVIADKHEQSIAKFGAILAQGIIDAGRYLHNIVVERFLFDCSLYNCKIFFH